MKQTLNILTLEPIEQRYTKQWYNYWKPEFSKYFDVNYIDGKPQSDVINTGRFLDVYGTNKWKAEQIVEVSEMFAKGEVKDGDTFLFMDGWHPGVTSLKYMAQLGEIDIKVFGYWHAGTWDKWDFISQKGLGEWCSHNELGWMKALDGHFVATDCHKQMILNHEPFKDSRNELSDKIYVVGFPMDWQKEIEKVVGVHEQLRKENLVIFPHRENPEKQPEVLDELATKFTDVEFVKTLAATKNKKELYDLTARAKVSFSASLQETYGINPVEGMFLGAIPLVPNRLSYVEMYDELFRYDSIEEAEEKMRFFLTDYNNSSTQAKLIINKYRIKEQSLESINIMAQIMLSMGIMEGISGR